MRRAMLPLSPILNPRSSHLKGPRGFWVKFSQCGGIAMPYIVQADESEDHSAVSKTHEDRKDALVTAVKWGSEGRKVKIIGNGRIYTPTELALSIINEEPR
jgi:hypothetical protein